MSPLTIKRLGQQDDRRYRESIYVRLHDVFRRWWRNIFLQPLIVAFFVVQVAVAFCAIFLGPFVLAFWDVNGWLIGLYCIVVVYAIILSFVFWVRVGERHR